MQADIHAGMKIQSHMFHTSWSTGIAHGTPPHLKASDDEEVQVGSYGHAPPHLPDG